MAVCRCVITFRRFERSGRQCNFRKQRESCPLVTHCKSQKNCPQNYCYENPISSKRKPFLLRGIDRKLLGVPGSVSTELPRSVRRSDVYLFYTAVTSSLHILQPWGRDTFVIRRINTQGQWPFIDSDSNWAASLFLSRLTTHCSRKPTLQYSLRGSESVPGIAQICQETAKLSVRWIKHRVTKTWRHNSTHFPTLQ